MRNEGLATESTALRFISSL